MFFVFHRLCFSTGPNPTAFTLDSGCRPNQDLFFRKRSAKDRFGTESPFVYGILCVQGWACPSSNGCTNPPPSRTVFLSHLSRHRGAGSDEVRDATLHTVLYPGSRSRRRPARRTGKSPPHLRKPHRGKSAARDSNVTFRRVVVTNQRMPRKCVHDTAPDSLHNPGLLSGENFAGTVFFARGLQWGVSGIVVTMPPLLVVGYVARRSHRLNFMPLSGLLSCATTDPARPQRRVRHGPPQRPRRLRLSPHHAVPHRRRTDHRADRVGTQSAGNSSDHTSFESGLA